ncbi:MAG: hypothetical protein GF388_02745 [Candidatus Aegiribacteria sp.]|nr:hypothetical protein [Candidatus Aegiribacteria sp.]MBD3294214.1 hypothetical protein [Candidatus Fermentibacteria bacterium]
MIAHLICAALVAFGAASELPPDPQEVQVIDRHIFRECLYDSDILLYMLMYNSGEQGTLEIMKGTLTGEDVSWSRVCRWTPENFNGDPITFAPVSVISCSESGGKLMITWTDRLTYIEGTASLYMEVDLETLQCGEFYMD